MPSATMTPPAADVRRLAYSLDEIAGPMLPVSTRTLKRAIEAGDLKTIKLRGRRLVRADELQRYIDSLTGGDLAGAE